MTQPYYDITVIGGGSGGLVAARTAAQLGANVLLIDKERLGGDCLNYGCVPSKSLIHVARVIEQVKNNMSFGLTSIDPVVDMAKVSAYIQRAIGEVRATEKAYVEKVTVKFGHVTFKSPHKMLLNGQEIMSRNIIIATGSHPALPDVEGLQEVGYLTNKDVFNLTALPASLLIIGGGPIGIEMGQALKRLGTQVMIIQRAEQILPKEDPEVADTLTEILKSEGIQVVTNAQVIKVARCDNKKVVIVKKQQNLMKYVVEDILLATGRKPNVMEMNVESAGIQYNEQGIIVNRHLQTSTPNILAIGDVIGEYLFTHVAAYQAGVAVRNALFPISKKKVNYRVVPWCTFTDPEVARVGLTLAEAHRVYKAVRCVKLSWKDIDRAQTENETAGFVKLILAGKKDEIVGAHIVGAGAGEMLGEISLAMQHHFTIHNIVDTIHAYPTINTGIQQAAYEAYLEGNAMASNRTIIRALLKLRGTLSLR
jgi:pyruvate/2-oxoglutarate dehydrogenase complex dihydrolipoamide dehydrogenase (E3) component